MYGSGLIGESYFGESIEGGGSDASAGFWPIEQAVEFLSNNSVALTTEFFQTGSVQNIYVTTRVLDQAQTL